ncbi:WD40 repeat domain-containing protein [Streptomyces sp. NPDC005374]|uniref:WD40 repeat domain-containing protein n=1 Tax=Streptomyces sp. NPDC005374 TaxID=3364713 RepID=UPI003682571A
MTSEATAAKGNRHRVVLDTVLKDATSPQGVVNELLGERQLWWKCCSEAVRADPSWLLSAQAKDLAEWIDSTAPDRPPADSMTPARHAYLLAQALSAPEGRTAEHDDALTRIRSAWGRSGLLSANAAPGPAQPSGRGVRDLPPDVAERLNAVIERLSHLPVADDEGGRSAGPDGVLMIGALLMAGAEPRRRPLVRVPVVFGGAAQHNGQGAEEAGATGVLELREFPAGPPGLYPDPRSMTGLRSTNGQFATALGRAWAVAGPRRGLRCVLWRVVLTDPPGPLLQIEGPSLGAAFALGLRELLRHPPSRRPSVAWLRGVFYGLRPRTAVTGALGHGERLVEVSGMESKLLAARRKGLRLVAPTANRPHAAHAPEPGDVKFAETLRQADRYARRFRTARLAIVLSLVAAATTSGVVVQYREAEARNRLATAHQLADVSEDLLQSDVGLAELFAERAYRHHPDPLTRRALFRAVTASPHLAGSVRASGTVSAVASARDGRGAVAGTQDGYVEQWTLSGTVFGDHKRLGRLPSPVKAVAADSTGETVLATDGTTVRVWAEGVRAAAPRIPAGQQPTAVAVSPSGRFVTVTTTTSGFGIPPTLWVLDRDLGETRRLDLKDMDTNADAVAFVDDMNVAVLEADYGTWNRISLKRLSRTAGSTLGFGVHNVGFALAPDGSHFTYSNKGSPLPIWPSKGAPDIDKPALQAKTEPGNPAALAVSRGGSRVAAAIGTTIRVTRTNAPNKTASEPIALPGAGTVTEDALTFVGDSDSKLISASQDTLSLWDLNQHSRIAKTATATIPNSCEACNAPRVSVSPDGRDVAVLDGNESSLAVQRLGLPGEDPRQRRLPQVLKLPGLSELLWQPDSSRLFVVAPDGSAEILARGRDEWRIAGSWPAVPNPLQLSDPPALLRFLPDGRKVAEVDTSGTVRFRDADSGKVLHQVPGPRAMAPKADSGFTARSRSFVALDPQAAHAAVFDYGDPLKDPRPQIHVIEIATGRIRTIPASGTTGVAYAGERLLVQRSGGALELWTASGSQRLDTIEGTADTAFGPVVGGDLVAETTSEDNTVRLLDLSSEAALGALTLPEDNKPQSTGMAFTADGTNLVTATEAPNAATEAEAAADRGLGQLTEWRLDPSDWIRTVCSSTGRELEPDEWEQHMGSEGPSALRCGE